MQLFDWLQRRWGVIALVLLSGTCGAQIARNATAEPVTRPLEKDIEKSQRAALSRVGGADVTSPLVTEPGLVGGNGVVEPRARETRLAAQVSAVVRAVHAREGARVKKGDVLVELEDSVEVAALRQAEAELASESAALARTLKGLRVEDKDAVAAEVQAARAREELSSAVRARTEKLALAGAVSPEELERARRQAESDAAAARVARARLQAAEAGSRREDILAARARVMAAEARVAQAAATVRRLSVTAPEDGEILQVKVRAGELYSVQGTEPLLVMGDTTKLKVRMDVDERDVAKVTLGASAFVMGDAFGPRRFAGRVTEIGRRFGRKNVRTDDPVERNDTKVLEVVIELEAGSALIPGQRVTSFIAGGRST